MGGVLTDEINLIGSKRPIKITHKFGHAQHIKFLIKDVDLALEEYAIVF